MKTSVSNAVVIGAGTMGRGIAMCLVDANISTCLMDVDQGRLESAMASVRRTYEGQVRRGSLTDSDMAARLAILHPMRDDVGLETADLVIEAAVEDMSVKTAIFRKLDACTRPGTILATNTSALDVDAIAAVTGRAADVIGMHFFSPAHRMRLLEVVRGAATSPKIVEAVLSLGRRLGKVAVVSGVCDGFIGNRILARYQAAASFMVAQGASPRQVDDALQAFGFALGPLRMTDLAGLDIGSAGRRRRARSQPGVRHLILADALVDAGRLGQKTGAGWYRYDDGRTPLPDQKVDEIVRAWRAENGICPRKVSSDETWIGVSLPWPMKARRSSLRALPPMRLMWMRSICTATVSQEAVEGRCNMRAKWA